MVEQASKRLKRLLIQADTRPMTNTTMLFSFSFCSELAPSEFRTTDRELALKVKALFETTNTDMHFGSLVLGDSRPGVLHTRELTTFAKDYAATLEALSGELADGEQRAKYQAAVEAFRA